jgi:hypothetical protein
MTTNPTNPTNHLAAELREILGELNVDPNSPYLEPTTRERLARLAEHVERLDKHPWGPIDMERRRLGREVREARAELDRLRGWLQPAEATELTATFGLDPEQEMRSRALDAAVRLPYAAPDGERVLSVAAAFADWIQAAVRDGSRPGEADQR